MDNAGKIPVIEKQGDNTFLLKGVLTMQTVSGLAREAEPLLSASKGDVCIDLAQVERADSAGLALLIEWQRLARRCGFSISFRNLPAQLMQIARVSELHEILPIQA